MNEYCMLETANDNYEEIKSIAKENCQIKNQSLVVTFLRVKAAGIGIMREKKKKNIYFK